jgi:hypothetical protein
MISWDCEGREYVMGRPTGRVAAQIGIDFTPAARELARAVRKRETRAQKILARLRQGPANSQELIAVGGLRFGARILELRRAGHQITTEEHAEFAVYRLED